MKFRLPARAVSFGMIAASWGLLAVNCGRDGGVVEDELAGSSTTTNATESSMDTDGSGSGDGDADATSASGSDAESSANAEASGDSGEASATDTDQGTEQGESTEGSETNSEAGSDGDDSTSSSESTGSDSSDETDTGDVDGEFARGVSWTRVTFNQGVAAILAEDGAVVEPDDRRLPIVRGRAGLVRASWRTDPNWEARELEAVLRLESPQGDEVMRSRRMVIGPSTDDAIDGAFHWHVDAELIQPGLEFSVGLYEIEPASGDDPDPPPRIPERGSAAFGVQSELWTLELTFVPLEYDGVTHELAQEDLADMAAALHAINPVSEVEFDAREPVVVVGEDLGSGLTATSEVRTGDGAPPQRYYVGLAPGGATGLVGLANIAGPSMNADRSVALGIEGPLGDGPDDFGTVLLRRQLGHAQGLKRPEDCTVGLERPGYDVAAQRWYSAPDHFDYLGTCAPHWVDLANFAAAAERIELLNSWR